MRRIITTLIGLVLSLYCLQAQSVTFDVINLNDSGVGSLRQAILDANANGNEATNTDIINIQVEGVILLTTSEFEDIQLLPGLFNINLTGNNVTIRRDASANQARIMALDNSTVTGITFEDGISAVTGGALYVGGTSFIDNCAFINNTAGNGVFSAALGEGFGGAIRIGNDLSQTTAPQANLTITNSTFTGNQAKFGAAINVYPGNILTIEDCTFSGNIVNTTDTDPERSTIYNSGTINMTNNIIANTIPDGTADLYDVGTTININVNNLIENCMGPGCTMGGAVGGFAFTSDPMLAPLANNGGATLTFAILPGSPVANAGIGAQPIPVTVPPPPGEEEEERVKDLPTMGTWGMILLMLSLLGLGSILIFSNKSNLWVK